MSTSCHKAWRTADESLVHDCDLQEVLGQCPSLQIIVIGLANPSQEAHRSGPAKFELQHTKHEPLSFQDLIDCIAAVNHVDDLLHRRTINLFVFRSDENGSSPH